jgi:meso-butanediol dehydrogenase / (S,S)-butanediol dehydrogenase / diacetyl reductase
LCEIFKTYEWRRTELRLKDKVAIVTGGASGIGKAVSELFAGEGAKVVIADIDENNGNAAAEQIKGRGGEAVFICTNITSGESIMNMVDSTIEKFGKLDILVNNAGIDIANKVTETSEADWNKTMDINLKSVFLTCKYAIPHMIENGGGRIVNVGSVLAVVASPNQAAYTASKGGVVAMSRQIAYDYADKGIRVNCICPGDTMTPMNKQWLESTEDPQKTLEFFSSRYPMKRFAEPIEQATVILFLASDDSSFVTGQSIPVDGGFSIW